MESFSLNKYGIATFCLHLSEKGYEVSNAFDFVNDLFNRMKNEQGFPHEIGVILGYPVEDVIEFEKHQGKNCKYCGCWKRYSKAA